MNPDEEPPAPKIIWTTFKWKRADLEGKRVEFHWPRHPAHGIGNFLILKRRDGKLFVQIVVVRQGRHWTERISTHYQLPQPAVDRIRPHPDPEIADFLLA